MPRPWLADMAAVGIRQSGRPKWLLRVRGALLAILRGECRAGVLTSTTAAGCDVIRRGRVI